jgi:hypothetical protein
VRFAREQPVVSADAISADDATARSRALLVVGPHRSGTSAVTRVLNLLGAELGSEMLPPKFDNPKGYWEHRKVFGLHERLLATIGSAWHDYRPLPAGWQRRPEVVALRDELLTVVRKEFSRSRLWALKDPRLSRLLPLWIELLEEVAAEPAVVVVVRNPLEVIRSIQKRDRFSQSKSCLLYLAVMLDAVRDSAGQRRAFVSYAQLLEDWRSVARHLADALALEWPSGWSNEAAIDSYLRPCERHHRHSLDELANEPGIPEKAIELYECLLAASGGRLDPLQAAYDRAREFFTSASDLFVPEIERLHQELDTAIGDNRRASAVLAECEQARRQLEAKLRTGENELALLEASLRGAEVQRHHLEARVKEEKEARLRAQAELEEIVRAEHSLERRTERLEVSLREAEVQRHDLEARVQEEKKARLRVQAELDESLHAKRRLERRTQRLDADLQKIQGHLTAILASRWYRFTRVPRALFAGASRWMRHLNRSLRN